MPYSAGYTVRKYTRKRRRPRKAFNVPRNRISSGYSRGSGGSVGMSSLDNHIHRFARNFLLAEIDIADGSATEFFNGFEFNMALLPNATDFTNLFDEYRITGARIRFILAANLVSSSSGGVSAGPILRLAWDSTDSAIPGDMDVLRQHGDCQTYNLAKELVVEVYGRPALRSTAMDGTTADILVPSSGPVWISTASADASHFGLKTGIDTIVTSSVAPAIVQVECKLFFDCRKLK